MTKVKGTVIVSLSDFINRRWGARDYEAWFASLTPRSRALYSDPAVPTKWYPMKDALSTPLRRMVEMFFEGDPKGARESGRHRADVLLRSGYGLTSSRSPKALVKRIEKILSTCYTPSVIRAMITAPGRGTVRLAYLSDLDPLIEARLVGFLERDLELCGARDVRIRITSSLSQGRPYSEYGLSWN
jgi:hypothetical protein